MNNLKHMRKLEDRLKVLWDRALEKVLDKAPNEVLADETLYLSQIHEYTVREISQEGFNEWDKTLIMRMLGMLMQKMIAGKK